MEELVLLYFDCSDSNSISVNSGMVVHRYGRQPELRILAALSTTTPSATATFASDYVSMMLVGVQ